MIETRTFSPDYAVVPGDTLQETIDALGLTQRDLSDRTGLATKTINQIIKGEAPITAETALLLERVTGVAAAFWNNLEATYRERRARLQAKKNLEGQVTWVRRFSYPQMVKLRLVPPAKDALERVENLVNYFGVASSTEWEKTYAELAGAARETPRHPSDLGDLSTWLRAGEILAQRRSCASYDRQKFIEVLHQIRRLTADNPAAVWKQVEEYCASVGVVVVLVPELPHTHIYGFTRWLTPQKALIQLSLRYKTDDMLWFTLFHEAAHILLHGKKDVFLECRDNRDGKEDEASQWAAETLVPFKELKEYMADCCGRYTVPSIRAFAQDLGVSASIVLGQLQHRKAVHPSLHNQLKRKLQIAWSGLY